jgi:hypothetical protein
MTLNIKKSQVVVFNAVQPKQNYKCFVNYDMVPLSVVPSFVYFRLCFDSSHDVKKSRDRSLDTGIATMFAMSKRRHELYLHNFFISVVFLMH